jgi:hypothetical protein
MYDKSNIGDESPSAPKGGHAEELALRVRTLTPSLLQTYLLLMGIDLVFSNIRF